MSTKKNVMGVFGYNNTRLYDVKKIKDLALSQWQADILLVKEGINAVDLEVTPYCFDDKPENPKMALALKAYLEKMNLNLVACLPFSDKGVIGAAHVAKEFGLFGDDTQTSFAMVNKHSFREIEASLRLDPSRYKKPHYKVVFSADEIKEIFKAKGSFFLKPLAEGNSRGCMKIESLDDIAFWLKENAACLDNGVICEELLANDNEFSFDGVDGSYWITQKFTTAGAFRAEYQHIMPAPFKETQREQIHATLEPLLKNLGSNGGAFHHEFFVLGDARLASVEPNRRPAGMWLWDLASWAFEDFSPWERWMNLCATGLSQAKPLKAKSFAGIRGVISKKSGKLLSVDLSKIESELEALYGKGNFKVAILKSKNDAVRSVPHDNSDFVAFVALRHPSYETLVRSLEQANELILRHTEIA